MRWVLRMKGGSCREMRALVHLILRFLWLCIPLGIPSSGHQILVLLGTCLEVSRVSLLMRYHPEGDLAVLGRTVSRVHHHSTWSDSLLP
jgi:hypothetical protein